MLQEYVDKGISGAKDRRPGLDQLISDARKGYFKVIVVSAIDRLARNVKHLVNLLDELKGYSVTIVSLRENLDFNSPLGQAMLTIISALAQLERDIIIERIRTSLAAKKKLAQDSGSEWRCGRPNVVTPDKIQRILNLRKAGHSIRQIEKLMDGSIRRSSIGKILKEGSDK